MHNKTHPAKVCSKPHVCMCVCVCTAPFLHSFPSSGAAQDACDSLAYRTLVSMLTLQAYMAMLNDTRWLVVMGTKGTCKTSIASGLAEHLALGLTGSHNSDAVIHFSLGKDGLDVSSRAIA